MKKRKKKPSHKTGVKKPEKLVDGYICGTGLDDPEGATFTDVFATRADAVKFGQSDVGWTDGDTFQTGYLRNEMHAMPNQLDAEYACDSAENEEFGEAMMESWHDKVFATTSTVRGHFPPLEDLQKRLDKLWDDWTKKYKLRVHGYWIDDVETHAFVKEPTA